MNTVWAVNALNMVPCQSNLYISVVAVLYQDCFFYLSTLLPAVMASKPQLKVNVATLRDDLEVPGHDSALSYAEAGRAV